MSASSSLKICVPGLLCGILSTGAGILNLGPKLGYWMVARGGGVGAAAREASKIKRVRSSSKKRSH